MNDGTKKVVVAGKEMDAVEIDGKVYVDTGTDLVEFVPQSRSVEVGERVVNFKEGECYANYYGVAQVVHIKADTMKVKYVSAVGRKVDVGPEYEYPIKAQAEAILREECRKVGEMRKAGVRLLKGGNDMWFAGWMAANARIGVLLKNTSGCIERFVERHREVTGESPDMDASIGETKMVSYGESPWGVGLRTYFTMPPEAFRSEIKMPEGVEMRTKGNCGEVTTNDFVWGMLKLGMRMGRNEGRVAAIAARLSPEDGKAFLEGAGARDEMKAA